MKQFVLACTVFFGLNTVAQFPLADSWMLNTTGATASYEYYPGPPPNTTTVNLPDSVDVLQVCYDNDYVYIRSNSLAGYTMGPWQMNPNQPSANEGTYRFSRNPTVESGTKVPQPWAGPLGISVNGIKMYGAGDARSYDASTNTNSSSGDGIWNGDAWYSEGATMDAGGNGHPDQNGNYHYHATPAFLYDFPSATHSPIIGWSFDGFPIYGPYGYSDSVNASSAVVRIETSYQLRTMSDRSTLPDGSPSIPPGPSDFGTFPLGTYQEDYEYNPSSGHLDEYNGRYCVTPEFPGGIYAYFITMDASGLPVYPYIIGPEYYGEVNSGEIGPNAGNISIPAGVTCLDGTSGTEKSEATAIIIYPNPAKTKITVTNSPGADYVIYDQLGRGVMSGTIQGDIDIAGLLPGTYIVEIRRDDQILIERLVKE